MKFPHESNQIMRAQIIWIPTAILAVGCVVGWVRGESADKPRMNKKSSEQLKREGTTLESQPAICRSNGDRLIVELSSGGPSLVALENLAAQRVLEAVTVDPSDKTWSINAMVTEFRGQNYLLLQRVNRISASQ